MAGNPDFKHSGYKHNWFSGSTDYQVATRIVESFISNLEKLLDKEKTLFYADEAMHNSAYPCERAAVVNLENKPGLYFELVDYDYARTHQKEIGEFNLGYRGKKRHFTKVEAVKRGIVFAETLDLAKQDES